MNCFVSYGWGLGPRDSTRGTARSRWRTSLTFGRPLWCRRVRWRGFLRTTSPSTLPVTWAVADAESYAFSTGRWPGCAAAGRMRAMG
eukprot:5526516-Alexandrium_andersonii.AAC.1